MSIVSSVIGSIGTLLDRDRILDNSSPITFSSWKSRFPLSMPETQMSEQSAPTFVIRIHMLVDGFVAHTASTFDLKPVTDLLGRPLQSYKLFDGANHLGYHFTRLRSPLLSLLSLGLRLLRTIPFASSIATQLSIDRAPVKAKLAPNLLCFDTGLRKGFYLNPILPRYSPIASHFCSMFLATQGRSLHHAAK
jgi:hypothetical protein